MQVPVCADRFDRFSRDIRHVQESMLPPIATSATPLAPGGLISAFAYRQPVGVVAAIASYNFPLTNMAGKVAPALAMGNTVIMKPAPQDPLAIVELARVLEEVGFPPGVVNLINSADPEPASVLTTSPEVDMVSFTGSTAVGQRIAAAGAPTMKRMLMELGGKGAAVVFEDADIKSVVTAIGSTWAFHSGQICTAPTRAVVHRSIFDQVVAGLSQFAGYLKVGDPTEKETVVGPLISAAQRQRVLDHIETGRQQGEIVVGGGRPDHLETGYYVEPTLVTGSNDITVAREEIFGPVVVAIPFDDEDEGSRHRQRHRVRSLRLRLLRRHGQGLPGGQTAPGRPCRHQHRPAQHGCALRRVQDEWHRPGRRGLQPRGLLGAAVDHLVRLSRPAHSPGSATGRLSRRRGTGPRRR